MLSVGDCCVDYAPSTITFHCLCHWYILYRFQCVVRRWISDEAFSALAFWWNWNTMGSIFFLLSQWSNIFIIRSDVTATARQFVASLVGTKSRKIHKVFYRVENSGNSCVRKMKMRMNETNRKAELIKGLKWSFCAAKWKREKFHLWTRERKKRQIVCW